MENQPLLLVVMAAVSLYIAKLWWDDFVAAKTGKPNPNALPGATPASPPALVIGAIGGVVILAGETGGEHALGLTSQQSNMTYLFATYTLLAAVIEEIIFRGFIVIEKRGTGTLWLSIISASILFAALHPFLWEWEGGMPWNGGVLHGKLTAKGWFSTLAVFAGSLWFYFVRFAKFNPTQSLLPCFAAHLAKNLGVILVKSTEGFLHGWF